MQIDSDDLLRCFGTVQGDVRKRKELPLSQLRSGPQHLHDEGALDGLLQARETAKAVSFASGVQQRSLSAH